MSDLTPKQQRFVEEYLFDLNATQAYIRAGYSEKGARVSACKLLANPNIASAVAAGKKERLDRTQVTVDGVIKKLARIADRCMQEEEVYDREGNPTGVFAFDAGNAIRALDLLGRHAGCGWAKVVAEVEIEGEVGVRIDPAAIARAVLAQRYAERKAAQETTTPEE